MGGELTVVSTPGQGSVFKVKLFLPEVHLAPGGAGVSPVPRHSPPRHGYAGPRRKILVVDNEEADRELLVKLLQPLGFELRTAASGHDCLDLLTTGYQPDVIFMDLAMPGIDGWETIRRVYALAKDSVASLPHIAIVSANAFDKGLDHDVGVPSDDFILKPVRHSEMLDWLAQRLKLKWLEAPSQPVEIVKTSETTARFYPGPNALVALREVVGLGFYRGILNQLDEMETEQPQCAAWIGELRGLARQFQFEAMLQKLSPVDPP
jgi:CheY-like chemotaxis protein